MADVTSKSSGSDTSPACGAEFDALGEVLAATITMATQAGSEAATVLLRRALATLHDRSAAQGWRDSEEMDDGGRQGPFNDL